MPLSSLARCSWWVPLGLLVACEPPRLPAPTITAVTPARVWNGADIPIVIEGTHFLPRIDVDARGYGTDLDGEWSVNLLADDGTVVAPLAGVSLQDPEHLLAVVESGVVPGDYRLEVMGPSRQRVVSEPLLEVSVNQEVGLRVDYYDAPTTYSAGERVRLLFEAVGFDSERVFTDVPVLVTLSGARVELIHTAEFEETQFLPLDDGIGFVAVLPDGQAILPVDLRAPGRLDVIARSAPGVAELQEGTLTMFVDGGSSLPAELRLPDPIVTTTDTGTATEPFVARAGEVFDLGVTVRDVDGSTILQEPLELTLGNACGTLFQEVVVQGVTQVPIHVERATDADGACPSDQIEVLAGAVGASDTFQVEGGDPAYFELDFLASEVRAGVSTLLFVRPTDDYGNTTSWDGKLGITDSIGSITETSCGAGDKFLLCSVVGTVAGEEITVTASSGDGLTGSVDGFTVRPSPTTGELSLSSPGKAAIAGEEQEVRVTFADAYGNPQESDDIDAGSVTLSDELGDVSCVLDAVVGSDAVYTCTFSIARDDAMLTVEGFGLLSTSPTFTVDNGVLAAVEVSAPGAVVAGVSFQLEVVGSDAFGNPYLRQDDPVVDLDDDLDGLGVASITLGADGTAAVSASLTRAGTTQIRARQAGVELGASDPVEVSAGPTDGIALSLGVPWGYVGEAAPLTVESVDAYGNRTALAGSVTVSSQSTATPDKGVTLVNGLATTDWTWTDHALGEVLEGVADAGPTGLSVPLHVARRCVDGPTAQLDFGGFDEALACFDETLGSATVSASLGGSTAGTAPLAGYALGPAGSPATIDTQPDLLFTLDEVGAVAVRGLAVATDGCGDEAEAVAYVGADDGSATGPVQLSLSSPDLVPFDLVTIDVGDVRDCARDLAAGATLNLRATAGELLGLTPTGEGLQLTLDAVGSGQVDLQTDGQLSSADVEVHAWVANGAARGLATVPLIGDEISPTVVAQAPSGLTLDPVDEIVITFSEPLLAATVLPSRFVLSGPGPSAVDSVTLSPDGAEVTLGLDATADGSAGAWTLTVSRELRDLAGRRLAGTWDGFATDYIGTFGDVGGFVDALVCPTVSPEGGLFVPDGDDGVGAQSDTLQVTLDSPFAPAWWVAEVRDSSGALVRQAWEVPLGPVDAWSWDGRDAAGVVVPNGTYSVAITPDDGVGNRGAGCVVQAVVDNSLGSVPGASEVP